MKLLKEFSDKDVIGKDLEFDGEWRNRRAARALVFNEDGEIAIMYSRNFTFHKLPGGGIEEGEDILLALGREIDEEVGVDITVGKGVGRIIEHRGEYGLNQESYCYFAKVKGDLRVQKLTEYESEHHDYELKWIKLDDAIGLLGSDKPGDYSCKFMVKRDLIFLKEAKKLI